MHSRLGALQNLLFPQRARFPAHLVDLHARPNQVFAADGISGEGGQDIVGGKRVGNDADPHAASDQFLGDLNAARQGDEVGRFDQ